MRVNLRIGRFTPTLVARIVIVATLTFALVSGIAPLGQTSSGHLCTMACCAGKPPHEAGSCMHGSCHIELPIRRPSPPPKEREKLYGAHKPQTACHSAMRMQDAPSPPGEDFSPADHQHNQSVASSAQEQSQRDRSRQTTIIAASMLTRQCPPDCRAVTFSYSSQNRRRDSTAISDAERPRPPSGLRLRHTSHNSAKELDALCGRERPRGPPLSYS